MSAPSFSPTARRDLHQILDYIARDNPRSAVAIVEKIEEKCWLLADSPDMGVLREDLASALRVWPVGRYLIVYRQVSHGIDVIRVVHGARDLERLFEDSN